MVVDRGGRYGVVSPCFRDKEEMMLSSCLELPDCSFIIFMVLIFWLLKRVPVPVPVSIADEMSYCVPTETLVIAFHLTVLTTLLDPLI